MEGREESVGLAVGRHVGDLGIEEGLDLGEVARVGGDVALAEEGDAEAAVRAGMDTCGPPWVGLGGLGPDEI